MAQRQVRPPRTPADEAWRGAPDGAHEWMSFPDPDDERTWLFDVTFLESNWTCIFGRGCQGVMTGPAPELVEGCCSYGAHFTGPKDARRVEAAAATLTPEQWQFWRQGQPRDGGRPARREARTQRRPEHPAGQRRLHLPQPPGLPRGTGMRPASCRTGPQRPPSRAQARRVLAASATPRRRGRRRRVRDVGHPAVGPTRLGRGWRRVPLVVHRGPRCVRRHAARLRRARPRAHRPERARRSTSGWSGISTPAPAVAPPTGTAPPRHGAQTRRPPLRSRSRFPIPPCAVAEHRLRSRVGEVDAVYSASGSSSGSRATASALRVSSSSSDSAMHHDACSSSGSAPHSAQRSGAVATDRFRLRASSKRRCRPFFTSDSSLGRGAFPTASDRPSVPVGQRGLRHRPWARILPH